jgi:large subunit ribosomal protein L29
MKKTEIDKMSEEELRAKNIELRKELIKMNAQAATGTTAKNPLQIKTTKKYVARLLTALNRRREANE